MALVLDTLVAASVEPVADSADIEPAADSVIAE
jgi:hypothetical protein